MSAEWKPGDVAMVEGKVVWRSELDLDRGTRSRWADLAVVRVLSEGIS